MFARIKKLFQILSHEQRKKLLGLQVLVILMAFAEVASVAAVGGFMALVSNMPQLLQGEGRIGQLYIASGINSSQLFLLWAGILALGVLTLSSITSIFTTWRLSLYAQQIG